MRACDIIHLFHCDWGEVHPCRGGDGDGDLLNVLHDHGPRGGQTRPPSAGGKRSNSTGSFPTFYHLDKVMKFNLVYFRE